MTEDNTIEITGKSTDAVIQTTNVDDACIEQVQEIANHEAFQNDIVIMPDGHAGSGAVIGFTMELGNRICPNTVGKDIGCFAGETEVKLLDGNDYRIDKLAEREEPFHVYSAQPDGTVEIGEATARKTRTDAELVAATLDNGETIRCTPDHEYMLRDGSYRQAQELSPGDSLMPLYTGETDDGYQLVFHNTGGQIGDRSVREHWLVARSNAMDIASDVSDPVVHHKNYDKKDNRPANLEIMPRDEHSSMHREQGGGDHWQSESFEQKRIEALINREQTQAEIETATDNITSYMENNPDEFALVAKQNGERGAETLREFNTSERECNICGYVADNPAAEYWHPVREHPEETDYELSSNAESAIENHKVVSVERLDVTEDVYCLNVPQYHNFALSAGVFVHNCGMTAYRFSGYDPVGYKRAVDEVIRSVVPLGYNTFGDIEAEQDYHIVNDFPWGRCAEKAAQLEETTGIEIDGVFSGEYFKNLCERISYDPERAINSLGTLGGGNHFIEVSVSESGDFWVVVHSGSRGIGGTIADYWQERAHENCDGRASVVREMLLDIPDWAYKFDEGTVSDTDLLQWVQGGMGEDWKKTDEIRSRFDGERIGELIDLMNSVTHYVNDNADGNELDYLDPDDNAGYLMDMVFAQTYAEESRHTMCQNIIDALGATTKERINSTHNYIDFTDGIIRKGATRARDGDVQVIPFNMRDGAVIVAGLGNDDWNYSAPHGAGRRGSRAWAYDEFELGEYITQMEGVFSTSISEETLDEAPMAYKDSEHIIDRMDGTAVEVTETLTPIINVKAE